VEHLRDLESALRQCGRLTAPGGMAIHSYEPYHSLRGGHGLGTLDAPFGHVRVDVHDHERYLFDQRGFEAPVAVPWVANALNRCSQSQVRDAAEAAGVPITFWRAIEDRPAELTVDIEAECLAVHPQIRPHDLLATEVLFGCLPGRDR